MHDTKRERNFTRRFFTSLARVVVPAAPLLLEVLVLRAVAGAGLGTVVGALIVLEMKVNS